ncbi:transporter substrate-binding domain-containing protein [Vibrio sp. SCSIO 43136]|nr:transporter substrate-binding domain-containing protein [Vibrio sp. SCSIO 43136]
MTIGAGEWPPFIGQDLPEQGFVAKILRESFANEGYEVEFVFRPWARLYQDAKLGKYDATAIWMFDHKRTIDFYYSAPVSKEEFVFFHHIDQAFDWKVMEDIIGMHLGGGIGYSYGDQLNHLIESEQVTMDRVKQPIQNLKRLALHRIDLFPEERHIGYYTLEQQAPDLRDQITHHPTPFLSNSNYLLFPRVNANSLALVEIFNRGLLKWKKENGDNQ